MAITRRDLGVAAAAIAVSWSIAALADSSPALLGSAVWEWNALNPKATDVGALRDVVRQPTATLEELEMHITTLNPGLSSHPPHQHPNEELVIIREGEVEVLSGGTWKRAGPGSIVFNASNSPHALRNVGAAPTTYHVINWKTASTPKG
jgi:XRE family transcriptional regulator, regulator of sulfur utilization